jgi:hypothetical protein
MFSKRATKWRFIKKMGNNGTKGTNNEENIIKEL